MSDDLGPREADAIKKLLDLAKFSILALLLVYGVISADSLGIMP
jgi:hypothetical protein